MNKKIIFFIILIILLNYLFYSYIVLDVKKVDVYLNVDNRIGFNVDSDALYFGTIPAGGEGFRYLNIENDRKARVVIKSYGELKEFIFVSKNNFILDNNDEVIVKLKVPKDMKTGSYNGTLKIIFLRF